jgi:ubiquinone/menaquinone biosynthesis C-methylase UbiE
MGSSGHPVFAWFYDKMGARADARGTAERRRQLLAHAAGRVVEVGAGTGLNLAHYPPGAVSEVLAVEPDPNMFRRLALAKSGAPVPVRLERASAEALPVEDGWADTVVMSLVLCSVASQQDALAEAHRALNPGGHLLFFEHVRSESRRLARLQDLGEVPWGWFGAGCHPNRDTIAAIRTSGFEIVEMERFPEPAGLLAKPHVLGVARPAR